MAIMNDTPLADCGQMEVDEMLPSMHGLLHFEVSLSCKPSLLDMIGLASDVYIQ